MNLRDISNILKVNIELFLNDYIGFINQYNQIFIDYFTKETDYPKNGFDKLDELLDISSFIYQQIIICRNSLNDYFCFKVIDGFEDCITTLQTINNYSRWLKSSFIKGRFKETTEVNFILRQNQTLEGLSSEIGYNDMEQGSIDLALRNHIKETDYTLGGGLLFQFNYQNDQTITLNTIIDNLTGENLLGKDIAKKLKIVDDDILRLSPKDTFFQTCSILTGLLKNHNPEFPFQGFNKGTISNKNLLSNTLPTFIRQLYATVGRDDSIASFEVTNISTVKDSLVIEIEFRSYLSGSVKQVVNGN